MNISKKHIALLGVAFLLIAIPAVAQVEDTVTFDAPSAFYVGDTQLPAGHYTVTQPDDNVAVLLVEDADGSNAAYVAFQPVDKDAAASETVVGFNRYGNEDFLSHIMIQGENIHLVILQSQAEEAAASVVVAEQHAVPATTGDTQPAASTDSQRASGTI